LGEAAAGSAVLKPTIFEGVSASIGRLNGGDAMNRSFSGCLLRFTVSCALALLFSIPASAAPAATGTLSGKIKGVVSTSSAVFPSTVEAFDVYAPENSVSAQLAAGGKYGFTVTPGPYVVSSTIWDKNGASYREKSKIQFVAAKKHGHAKRRPAALAAVAGPQGPTVCVGNIQWQDGSGGVYVNYDKKPWLWDSVFLTDLTTVPRTCQFYVVEDRQYGRFDEILKELKFQSSKYIDPSMRINYRQAVNTLNLWAPQFRVTGTVVSSSQTLADGASVQLQLVDLAKNKTVWSMSYSITDPEDIIRVSEQAAKDIEQFLCDDDLPLTITGSYTSVTTFNASPLDGNVEQYSGNVTYTLVNPDFWRSIAYPLGVGQYAPYVATAVSYNASISGGSPCSITGQDSDSYSAALPTGVGGALQLEIRTEDNQPRHYSLTLNAPSPSQTTADLECAGSPSVSEPKTWEPSLSSPGILEGPFEVSGTAITGNYESGLQKFTWNLQMEQ
jgi:hypothetical protein